MRARLPYILLFFLALSMLFSPLIHMEIGPLGKAAYGPTVPDIHISGGWITGKDLRWEPIRMAQYFQRVCILLYALLVFASAFAHRRGMLLSFWYFAFSLLICFPLWLKFYEGGVLNNSDDAVADMRIHYGFGLYLFVLIFVIHILMLIRIHTSRTQPLP